MASFVVVSTGNTAFYPGRRWGHWPAEQQTNQSHPHRAGTHAFYPAYAGAGDELFMFDKVSQAYTDLYDGITGEYLGRAEYTLTPEIESVFLDYVNERKMKDPIVFQDVSFYPGSDDYTNPSPYEKYSRRGIFRGMFRDRYSLKWVPVEIFARFNIRTRIQPEEGRFYHGSIEYSDIVVEGMNILTENAFNPGK